MQHKKTPTVMTIGLLLVVGLGSMPGAAADDECRNDDYGWGKQYPSCGFSCNTGETLFAGAGVDDSGYAEANADCGGTAVDCASYDGGCSRRGTILVPAGSHDGDCNGVLDGGGAWTDGYVKCGSGQGDTITLIIELIGNVDVPDCGAVEALRPLMPQGESFHIVIMTSKSGVFGGVTFTADQCETFLPTVASTSDGTLLSFS